MKASGPRARHRSKRIALYNHKGGVGKTTLAINIAAALGEKGKRVLLVDSDPQCNLTSYLVNSDVIDDWLDKSDTPQGVTIWSAVTLYRKETGPDRKIEPSERLPNVFLLPGDIQLSEFEQELNDRWLDCLQRRVDGFRGSTLISGIVNSIAAQNKIDYVFYDVGPNIGPLNRVILLDCDYFIVPAACDLFSTRGLKTLGYTLESWIKTWQVICQIAPDSVDLLPGAPRFLGYILQQFRMYNDKIADSYRPYVAALEKAAASDIAAVLRRIDRDLASGTLRDYRFGDVKNFSGLATMSQMQGRPFWAVSGGTKYLREQARTVFEKIASRLIDRTSDRRTPNG